MLALRLDKKPLLIHLLLALAYGVPMLLLDTLTQSTVVDGAIGALLGLYVCSLPARNALDVLFANRFVPGRIWRSRAGRGWLALNGLVVLAGWATILLGMVSLVG
jgi:hypothetical protein